jgi:hypothetical protein
MNLVVLKVGAEDELLFQQTVNKWASEIENFKKARA